MLDVAKVADLVLLLVDASFGFEMETFEFLNILQVLRHPPASAHLSLSLSLSRLQVHGFPKVMGVLTHLDVFRSQRSLRKTKKRLKNRFWTEIYQVSHTPSSSSSSSPGG